MSSMSETTQSQQPSNVDNNIVDDDDDDDDEDYTNGSVSPTEPTAPPAGRGRGKKVAASELLPVSLPTVIFPKTACSCNHGNLCFKALL